MKPVLILSKWLGNKDLTSSKNFLFPPVWRNKTSIHSHNAFWHIHRIQNPTDREAGKTWQDQTTDRVR